MLKCSPVRRRVLLGAPALVGVAAALFSFDSASAQGPAVSGVYNRAASMGAGAPGAGYGASGGMRSGTAGQSVGAALRENGASSTFVSNFASSEAGAYLAEHGEPQVVEETIYEYAQHEADQPIVALEALEDFDGILSASGDKTVRIWQLEGKTDEDTSEWRLNNARTRKIYQDVHRQGLTDATFSPDSAYVLTASYDRSGRLWTIGNQENMRAYLGAQDRLWSISASLAGDLVGAACNDGRAYFWEPTTAKRLGFLPNRADSQKAFDKEQELEQGAQKLLSDANGAAKTAGAANNAEAEPSTPAADSVVADSVVAAALPGHEGPIFALAFAPDGDLQSGEFCATAGADGTIRVWRLTPVYRTNSDYEIKAREVSVIKASADKIYSLKFSEDGQYLLSASRDKTARLWNASTGDEVCRFVGHTGAVRKAIFAGPYVLTASDDGTVRVWSPNSGSTSVAANGGRDAYGDSTMGGTMVGVSGGMSPSMPMPTPGVSGGMGPSGSLAPAYAGSEGRQGEQQAATGKPTREPGKPKGTEVLTFKTDSPVFSCAVSNDGVYVFGGCADGVVRVWQVPGEARYYDESAQYGAQGGSDESGAYVPRGTQGGSYGGSQGGSSRSNGGVSGGAH